MCTRPRRTHGSWWCSIEARFATIVVGQLVADRLTAALICIAITLGLLVAQIKLQPFLEEVESETAHWSSPNKMAALSYITQLGGSHSWAGVDFNDPVGAAVAVLLCIVTVVALIILPLTELDDDHDTLKRCRLHRGREQRRCFSDGNIRRRTCPSQNRQPSGCCGDRQLTAAGCCRNDGQEWSLSD